jgi:hypothetical protein
VVHGDPRGACVLRRSARNLNSALQRYIFRRIGLFIQ